MNLKRWLTIVIVILLISLTSCGGGTSGSGLKTYQGTIDDTASRSLPGVNVTIEATGDNATTNSDGEFLMQSSASGKSVSFLIESPDFVSRFVLQEVPETSAHISLKIVVDTATDVAVVNQLTVKAGFVGVCDNYFENSETIRQANHILDGTICSLKVRVLGDGQLLGSLPVAVQYNGCDRETPWETLAVGLTGNQGDEVGIVKFSFPFHDSATYCRYRVVAPFNSSLHVPVYYPIDTFTEQKIFPPAGSILRGR